MSRIGGDAVRRESSAGSRWFQQPILWLGFAIFVASMAGCIWIIVISSRYADQPLPTGSHAVMGVPASARSVSGRRP